jgi:hypothetical protein
MISKIDAILSLVPKAEVTIRGNEVEWHKPSVPPVSEAQINAELTRLQTEYEAKEYQRKRAIEYPSLADFADAYYWMQKGQTNLMDEYVAKCDAVKNKFPKETT